MPNRYAYINKFENGFKVVVCETAYMFMEEVVYTKSFLDKQEAIDYCKKHKYTIMNLWYTLTAHNISRYHLQHANMRYAKRLTQRQVKLSTTT